MSKRTPKLLLEDMLDAIDHIQAYTKGMGFDDFNHDQKTKDAVVRNFEIIGEAANKLPDETLESNPRVDWKNVIGFRHVLIHHYFGVDYSIVWGDLNRLKKDIKLIYNNL